MRGEGHIPEQIGMLFRAFAKRYGLDGPRPELSTAVFVRPKPVPQRSADGGQFQLFFERAVHAARVRGVMPSVGRIQRPHIASSEHWSMGLVA
mgnify:CR=1 FL=1